MDSPFRCHCLWGASVRTEGKQEGDGAVSPATVSWPGLTRYKSNRTTDMKNIASQNWEVMSAFCLARVVFLVKFVPDFKAFLKRLWDLLVWIVHKSKAVGDGSWTLQIYHTGLFSFFFPSIRPSVRPSLPLSLTSLSLSPFPLTLSLSFSLSLSLSLRPSPSLLFYYKK